MYDDFYHLKQKPFQLNPDPDFFFNSMQHNRALAYLRYGVMQGEGFVVVIGRPGTGKTMLVKLLVRSLLNNSNITIGEMVASRVSSDDLLKILLSTFGLSAVGDDKPARMRSMQQFLLQQANVGKRVLLLVDEAQNLTKDALEELRLMSNSEVAGRLVFQIFLIGQNQLGDTLSHPDMEQLFQRIAAPYILKPLDEEEAKKYILFRLEKAGWLQNPQFDDAIFHQICAYTQGIPRIINSLCERILLYGFLEELTVINLSAVEIVIAEMKAEFSISNKLVETQHELAKSELITTGDSSLEERVLMLERMVLDLQNTVNKERALLRKAILIQLDMDSIYTD